MLERKLRCKTCQLTSWEPFCPFCERCAQVSQLGALEALDCSDCGRLATSYPSRALLRCSRCQSMAVDVGSAREDLQGQFITPRR